MHRIKMPLYAPATAYTNILSFLSFHSARASAAASPDLILMNSQRQFNCPVPAATTVIDNKVLLKTHRFLTRR
jgi:hypothetical protein